jgi:hypothetical protein
LLTKRRRPGQPVRMQRAYTLAATPRIANLNFSRSEASGGIAAAPMLVARLHARSMTPKHGRVHRSLRPMCSKVVGYLLDAGAPHSPHRTERFAAAPSTPRGAWPCACLGGRSCLRACWSTCGSSRCPRGGILGACRCLVFASARGLGSDACASRTGCLLSV